LKKEKIKQKVSPFEGKPLARDRRIRGDLIHIYIYTYYIYIYIYIYTHTHTYTLLASCSAYLIHVELMRKPVRDEEFVELRNRVACVGLR